MISSISGTVKSTSISSIVVEVGGVGILVQLPVRVAAQMQVGKLVNLHTYLIVREDALTLYGFVDLVDRDFFELLLSVTGIGPKVAQSALSIYEPEELASAIASENSAVLERIPGLGKKGAQRTVLELKEKVNDVIRTASSGKNAKSHWRTQLQSALIGLGFTARDAETTIDSVATDLGSKVDETDISQLLKLALQNRGRN